MAPPAETVENDLARIYKFQPPAGLMVLAERVHFFSQGSTGPRRTLKRG